MMGAAGVGLEHLRIYQAGGGPVHLGLALRRAAGIIAGTTPTSDYLTGVTSAPGVDPAAGRTHGLAGVTGFLLALAAETGEQRVLAAAQRAGQLAERTRTLLPSTTHVATPPLAMSWCQGLAGIGQTLLQASALLQDDSLFGLAQQAAEGCVAYLPRFGLLGRCCGAAGVGHFLIDLALVTQDERDWRAAGDVTVHMLLRSAGSPGRRIFMTDSAEHNRTSWAFGITGLLSFFRRLDRRGGPDSIPS